MISLIRRHLLEPAAASLRELARTVREDAAVQGAIADEIDHERARYGFGRADSVARSLENLALAWAEIFEALAELLHPLGALVPYGECTCGPSTPAHPDERGRIICDRCHNIIAYIDRLDTTRPHGIM